MLPAKGLYHTCFSVPDIERARDELGPALDLTWTAIRDAPIRVQGADGEQESVTLRFCYSLQGPPYIELIEGPPGHPYFATPDGGHVHHVGLFVEDLAAAARDYEAAGFPMQFVTVDREGRPAGISYHRNPYGASIELVSTEVREFVKAMIQGDGGDA